MRLPPTDALVATAVGLATGIGTRVAAVALLARAYRPTAVPDLLGLAFGAAVGFLLLARSRRDGPWKVAAASALFAGLCTSFIVTVVPRATESGQMSEWVPWVAIAAALLWVGGWWIERATARRWPIVTGLLVALAFSGGGLSVAKEAHRTLSTGKTCRAWNVYHYYLGSKYFADVGYTELYAATLAADDLVASELAEGARSLKHVRHTRDMRTYQVIPRARAVASLDPDIDEATLRALHHDLRGLLPALKDGTWAEVISDLGYNPAPAWAVVGKPIASLLDTYGTERWILTNLDVPLFLLSLGAMVWAWGPRAGAGMVLFVTLVGFNRSRLLGGFLAYDWLASLLIGMALYRRGWGASGGAVLSWGAMTRVFPGFLIFPGLVALGWSLWKRRPLTGKHTRFVVGFTSACAVWFALSHTTGRGLHTWPEWVEGIRVHSTLHAYNGRARLGMPRLAAHEPTASDYWHARPRTIDHEEAGELHARIRPWQLLGVLVVVLAALRRKPEDRALWMLALVWVAVTTSRYYGSSWALLMVLGLPEEGDAGPEQSVPGVVAATGVLLLPAVFYASDQMERIYFWTNYWMGFLLLVVAASWLVGDARRPTSASE